MPENPAGTVLVCSNPDCRSRLRIEVPTQLGDTYRCACGHHLEPAREGSN